MAKYYLLVGDTNQVSIFFPYVKIKMRKQQRFILQSLTCGGSVNYDKSVHHPIHTLPVAIGNTLAIFKTNR